MRDKHIVAVTGYRDYAYPRVVWMTLSALYVKIGPFTLFHGACEDKLTGEMVGADRFADDWAHTNPDVRIEPYPADWDQFPHDAGPLRNRQMVYEATQRLPVERIHGLAFPGPRSRGTWHCVKIMRDFGIEPDIWNYARVRRWQSSL